MPSSYILMYFCRMIIALIVVCASPSTAQRQRKINYNETIQFFQDSVGAKIQTQKSWRNRWIYGSLLGGAVTATFHFLGEYSYQKYENAKSGFAASRYWDKTIQYDRAYNIGLSASFSLLGPAYLAQRKIEKLHEAKRGIPVLSKHVFNDTLFVEAGAMETSNDSGYMIAGNIKFASNNYKICLMQTDYSGKVQWQRIYDYNQRFVHSMRKVAGGGYLFVGQTKPPRADDIDIWCLKTDNQGRVEWERTFEQNGVETALFAVQMNRSDFIILGTEKTLDDRSRIGITKIDSLGNKLWNKSLGGDNDYFLKAYCSIEDMIILTGGTRKSKKSSLDAFLLNMDEDGRVSWQKLIGEDAKSEMGQCVVATQDGGLAVIVSRAVPGQETHRFDLIKIDAKGVVKWTNAYHEQSFESIAQLKQATDGGFVFGGKYKDKIFLAKTDVRGVIQLQGKYKISEKEYLHSILEADDNSLMVLGSTKSQDLTQSNIFLIKTFSFAK